MLSEMETAEENKCKRKRIWEVTMLTLSRWCCDSNTSWYCYQTHIRFRRITTWMSRACLKVHIPDWPATCQDSEKPTASLAVRHTAQTRAEWDFCKLNKHLTSTAASLKLRAAKRRDHCFVGMLQRWQSRSKKINGQYKAGAKVAAWPTLLAIFRGAENKVLPFKLDLRSPRFGGTIWHRRHW